MNEYKFIEFLNSPIVVAVISSILGSLITFYLMHRKENVENERQLREFDVALDMLRIEIEENLMRYIKTDKNSLSSYEFKTFYWEKYQSGLSKFYPDIYKDYLFYYNTAMDTLYNKNVNCFKILAVGYNLVNRLYEPNKKYVALSTQFHPRYKGEKE